MTPSQWKWKFLNGKAENAEVLWRCEEEPILNTPLNHDTVSGTQSRFSARAFKGSHWNWLKESGQITTQHGSIWTRYTVTEESSRTQSCKIFWNLNHSAMAKTPNFNCDLVHTLKEIGLPSHMDNSHMLSLLEQKMFIWMTAEMKSRMRATALLRTSHRSLSVRNVNKVNDDEKKAPHYKCWLCKSPTHWPDQCQKFAAMNRKGERRSMLVVHHPLLH